MYGVIKSAKNYVKYKKLTQELCHYDITKYTCDNFILEINADISRYYVNILFITRVGHIL